MSEPGRWARVTAVFQETLERDEAARAAYLDVACADDGGLRAEVESLLAAHFAAANFANGSPMEALPSSAVEKLSDDAAPSNASLASGTRLGPYEIIEPLSSGGMGELFRARDTRLGRDVAIKVPFATTTTDPATRVRFQREARAIATLNHPHICTVHDVGSDSGIDYLVLELLQGETLASRLKRGPLPVDKAIAYAIEIAGALARAHRDGIVHRDLKPGNVMLTPSGAKVLDFGLARITRGDADAPMSAEPLSDPGAVLGTIQYMAPEQLAGRVADARSDIYAFGATLFEMLTGKRAFESSNAVHSDLPPTLDRVLRTCLEKDPDVRFESLHDVTKALQWARDEMRDSTVGAADAHPGDRRRRSIAIAAAVAVCALVAGAASWTMFGRPSTEAPTVRFSIPTPPMPNPMALALSPDGQTIAFSAAPKGTTNMLYVRAVGALEARPLQGTEGAFAPFWSPDGQYIGFASQGDRKLKIVAAAGGQPKVVCDVVGALDTMTFYGGSWSRDGVIVFSTGGRPQPHAETGAGLVLYRVPAAGGLPIPLRALDRAAGESGHRWPSFLPDGRRFLYLSWSAEPAKRAIVAASLDSNDRTRVMTAEAMAMYVHPGYLVFSKQDRLFAQRFDSSTLRLKGEPMTIVQGLIFNSGRGAFSASSQSLVFRSAATSDAMFSLVWIDRNGTVSAPFRDAFNTPSIRLAPNGKRVALVDFGEKTGEDIWIYDLDRDQKTILANDTFADHYPLWSPDGSRIAFDRGPVPITAPHLLYEQRVDRAEPARLMLAAEPTFGYQLLDWTSKYIVYQRAKQPSKPGDRIELWAQSGDGQPSLYVGGFPIGTTAAVSPNGKWLAYVDRENGGQNLVVRSFPNPSKGRNVISTSGSCPRWRQDGRELYFVGLDEGVNAVSISPDGAIGKPQRLFTISARSSDPRSAAGPSCAYDVRPDGQRFIVAQPGGINRDAPINVVLNWMADLKP